MQKVYIVLFDELDEIEVTREIDAGVLYGPNTKAALDFEHDIVGDQAQQKARLEAWIDERANAQHETILTLVSWEIRNY